MRSFPSALRSKAATTVGGAPFLRDLFWFSTFTKLLLFSAYRSTDFEVHRNWLAITHQVPVAQWYEEATSVWTLDYPPFFAWTEYALSHLARWVDPGMLTLSADGYTSPACTVFQRLTVLITEQVLLWALARHYLAAANPATSVRRQLIVGLVFLNPGLYLVDHIHFQYNGALYGLLILAVTLVWEGRDLAGALAFTVLLNFKHIYMYFAPAFFVYLLSGYGLAAGLWSAPLRLARLGFAVLGVFAVSLGPFAYYGKLPHLAARLFPFRRGLCHALWAANFWSLYSTVDRVFFQALIRFGLADRLSDTAPGTRGVVGGVAFAVLPDVSAHWTFILTVVTQLPGLVWLFCRPTRVNFIKAVVLCGYTSFLFGWHVHEKAYMLTTVPMALLLEANDVAVRRLYLVASTAGAFGLFPLLYRPAETPVKLAITVAWTLIAFFALDLDSGYRTPVGSSCVRWSRRFELAYLAGFVGLQCFVSVIHPLLLNSTHAFLPILLTACYGALGLLYTWLQFYAWFYRTAGEPTITAR